MTICAMTALCEEDSGYVSQYLAEMQRLNLPFVVLFDRCSPETRSLVAKHKLCAGACARDERDGEFHEQCKQEVLDLVQEQGYDWALVVDIDETFELDAVKYLNEIVVNPAFNTVDYITCRWLNLWGDTKHVRVDLSFGNSYRVKFYNLQKQRRWVFDHKITNGAKLVGRETVLHRLELVCLHHGLMTQELRELHKKRWDRIYSTALKGDKNPYGFWNLCCDESIKPVLVKHNYL